MYERVLSLADALSRAVSTDNEKEYSRRYHELEALCDEAMRAGQALPFYFETLADFTLDDEESLDIYEQALALADGPAHIDARVSILLAIAERYRELDDAEAALGYAREADKSVALVTDEALKRDLAEFLASMEQGA